MSEKSTMKIGSMLWMDLTVPKAGEVKDFYEQVVKWKHEEVSMGEYSDYNMLAPDGTIVTGICNKRGLNENIPSVWMPYIVVENIDESLEACKKLGGKIITPKQKMNKSTYCVIQDIAGAFATLYQAE